MQVDCAFVSATIPTIIFTLPIYSAQSWAFKVECYWTFKACSQSMPYI